LSTAVAWRAQRRQYIALLKQKRSAFWTERINAEQAYPCRLWRSFDELFGRGRTPLSADVCPSDLHHYFDNKVAAVRASTADADSPIFTPAPVGCVLRAFTKVTLTDVVAAVKNLPGKQCTSDPMPTWLLFFPVH